MKTIYYFTTLFLIFTSAAFAQSTLNYQAGTGVVIQPGADVCADKVTINGTFSGGGTICGATAYVLNLTVFIQGFYNPASNTMVADTATVYLRSSTTPFGNIDSSKSILTSTGAGTFIFFNITNGTNYYIDVRHRNSIETWSFSAVAFSSGTLTYDFTPAANKAYGNNMIQVDPSPVKFGIYSGDVNQDGIIDLTDNELIDNDSYNFVTGYVRTDVNGDNIVDLADAAIADNNALNFVGKVTP
ncbi:MAG: hypothetical protein M3R36_19445 [Bacteroidota bacterium]|nr:hypothetical protein [Bacteroidota bacterium]